MLGSFLCFQNRRCFQIACVLRSIRRREQDCIILSCCLLSMRFFPYCPFILFAIQLQPKVSCCLPFLCRSLPLPVRQYEAFGAFWYVYLPESLVLFAATSLSSRRSASYCCDSGDMSRTVGPEGPATRIADGVHRKLHAIKPEEAKSLAVWRQLDSIN